MRSMKALPNSSKVIANVKHVLRRSKVQFKVTNYAFYRKGYQKQIYMASVTQKGTFRHFTQY